MQYVNQISKIFFLLFNQKLAFSAGCETSSSLLCCYVSYCLVKRLKKEMLAGLVLVNGLRFLSLVSFSLTPEVVNRLCTTSPVVPKMKQ